MDLREKSKGKQFAMGLETLYEAWAADIEPPIRDAAQKQWDGAMALAGTLLAAAPGSPGAKDLLSQFDDALMELRVATQGAAFKIGFQRGIQFVLDAMRG